MIYTQSCRNFIGRYLVVILFFALQVAPTKVSAAEEKTLAEEEMGSVEELPVTEEPSISREMMVGAQIESSLSNGEAHWLGAGEEKFLAIYTPYTQHKRRVPEGAILLLHDLGANADWPQLIKPLREQLADKGWNTLSIQSPMLDPREEKKEYLRYIDAAVSRISVAVNFLKQEGEKKIVLIGHGFGAATATLYLTQNPDAPIAAFVGLSLPGADALKYSAPIETPATTAQPKEGMPNVEVVNQPEESNPSKVDNKAAEKEEISAAEPPQEPGLSANDAEPVEDRDFFAELQKLKLPILDIYAEEDHLDVTRATEKRTALMQKAGIRTYLQIRLEGADHYYIGREKHLVKRIRGWLRKNARP